MRKIRVFGLICMIIGALAAIGGEEVIGLFLVAVGAYLKFGKFAKYQEQLATKEWHKKNIQLTRSAPKTKELEFFIAYSNKFDGYRQMIEEWKDTDDPYEGLTTQELKEELEAVGRVYRNDVTRYSGITLVDEPTNQYNPQAIKIMSDVFGQIGYISDSDLEEIRKLRNENRLFRIKVYGGDYKELDDDDKIVTGNYKTQGKLVVRVPV